MVEKSVPKGNLHLAAKCLESYAAKLYRGVGAGQTVDE